VRLVTAEAGNNAAPSNTEASKTNLRVDGFMVTEGWCARAAGCPLEIPTHRSL
jgi:hypothetical protein